MALDLLKAFCYIGAIVYDIFYTIGIIANTPINQLSNTVISYTNPISNTSVGVDLTNDVIVKLIQKLGEFVDNNFLYDYGGVFGDSLTILGVIIGLIITIALIRFIVGLIGAFLPD